MSTGHTASSTPPIDDPRFTMGLLVDIREVLRKHGYSESTDASAHGDVLVDLRNLALHFEGYRTDEEQANAR